MKGRKDAKGLRLREAVGEDGGDDAGVLALQGLEPAARVIPGRYRVNIFVFRSFPVV